MCEEVGEDGTAIPDANGEVEECRLERKPSKQHLLRVFSSCEHEPDPLGPVPSEPPPPPEHHDLVTPDQRNITPKQWLKRIHNWDVSHDLEELLFDETSLKIDKEFMQLLLDSEHFVGILDLSNTVVTVEALELLVDDNMAGKVTDLNMSQCHFIVQGDNDHFMTRRSANFNAFRVLLAEIIVKQAESLETLNVAGIFVVPFFPADGLSKLRSLSLAKTQSTKFDLQYLVERCKTLDLLSLQYVNRSLRQFAPIVKLKNLTKIWLSGCKITDKDVSNIIRQFEKQLVDFRINDVTGFTVYELLDTLSKLKILYVGHQNRPQLSLNKLASYGKLEVLSMKNCSIRSCDLDLLAKHCGKILRKLELNDRLLDMQNLAAFLDKCTVLEALALDDNAVQGDMTATIGVHASPTLRYLSLLNSPMIEILGLERLCEQRVKRMEAGEQLQFLTCLHSAYRKLEFDAKILKTFNDAKFTVIRENSPRIW